jgi:hypothetical protein
MLASGSTLSLICLAQNNSNNRAKMDEKKNNHRPAGSTDAPFFLSHYSGSVSRTPLSHPDGRLDWNKIKVIIVHPPTQPTPSQSLVAFTA